MNHPHSEAWKYARESIATLCGAAKKNGVTILLEAVSSFVSDLMMDSATLARMMREVDADNLGCCVNSSAAFAAKETLDDYFKRFGDKIGLVQLSDSVADNEQLPWGTGVQDLDAHLRTLKENNYTGDIAMELLEEELAGDPEANYSASIAYFGKHID
jgi:sugar phosphate isomerase/epimerase